MLPEKIQNLLKKIEKYLWQRGFRNATVRRIALVLLVMSATLLVLGVLILPLTSWVFWLGAGAALSAWNFCSLADFVQRFFPIITAQNASPAPADGHSITQNGDASDNARSENQSMPTGGNKKNNAAKPNNSTNFRFFLQGQIFRSYFRLFITGILVYTALVVCRANPFALAAGLSAAVLVMPVLILLWPAKSA